MSACMHSLGRSSSVISRQIASSSDDFHHLVGDLGEPSASDVVFPVTQDLPSAAAEKGLLLAIASSVVRYLLTPP